MSLPPSSGMHRLRALKREGRWLTRGALLLLVVDLALLALWAGAEHWARFGGP